MAQMWLIRPKNPRFGLDWKRPAVTTPCPRQGHLSPPQDAQSPPSLLSPLFLIFRKSQLFQGRWHSASRGKMKVFQGGIEEEERAVEKLGFLGS